MRFLINSQIIAMHLIGIFNLHLQILSSDILSLKHLSLSLSQRASSHLLFASNSLSILFTQSMRKHAKFTMHVLHYLALSPFNDEF